MTRAARPTATIGVLVAAAILLATVAVAAPIDRTTRWSDASRTDWGVTGLAPVSDAFQFDSPVFSVVRIRGRIFVAGAFTTITHRGATTQDVSQPYIAAFDARSGAWISTWRPRLDGAVFALAAAPDGSALYVGGEFASVNDQRKRALVALDPRTGAIVDRFRTRLRRVGTVPQRVHALEVRRRALYIGGSFGTVAARGRVAETLRVARVDRRTGRPDPKFDPAVEGGAVWAIAVAPDGRRVYLGGLFDAVDGRTRKTFVALTRTGDIDRSVPARFGNEYFSDPTRFDHVAAIEAVGGRVFVGGQNHRLVVVRARDFDVRWVHTTGRFGSTDGRGGDFQTLHRSGRIVFAGCHCWGRVRSVGAGGRTFSEIDSVLAFDARTGRHLRSYAPSLRGREGAWGIAVAADGCLWIGGDIERSGGELVDNLARHCPT